MTVYNNVYPVYINFFLFMPAGHIATVRDLGNAAETKNEIM